MRRTLYGVMKDTTRAIADVRAATPDLSPGIDQKLGRFEAAVAQALTSSPDGEAIASPEELVTLDALCDLHVAAQNEAEPLRERLRPIIDEWIAHAAMTGLTPLELERAKTSPALTVEAWLQAED